MQTFYQYTVLWQKKPNHNCYYEYGESNETFVSKLFNSKEEMFEYLHSFNNRDTKQIILSDYFLNIIYENIFFKTHYSNIESDFLVKIDSRHHFKINRKYIYKEDSWELFSDMFKKSDEEICYPEIRFLKHEI